MPVRSEYLVAWGECDAAGIVYFPKFFNFMDLTFQALMHKGGYSHRGLQDDLNVRLPIIDTGAKFSSPISFEEKLVVEADVVHWGTKSFRIQYKGTREGMPVFEGHEVRVWAAIAQDGSITTAAIPLAFKDAISAAR